MVRRCESPSKVATDMAVGLVRWQSLAKPVAPAVAPSPSVIVQSWWRDPSLGPEAVGTEMKSFHAALGVDPRQFPVCSRMPPSLGVYWSLRKHESTVWRPPAVRDRSAWSLPKREILSEDLRNHNRPSWTGGRSLGLVVGGFVFDAERHRWTTGPRTPGCGLWVNKSRQSRMQPPLSRDPG